MPSSFLGMSSSATCYRYLRRTEDLHRLYPHERRELTAWHSAAPEGCAELDRVLDAEWQRDRACRERRRVAVVGPW